MDSTLDDKLSEGRFASLEEQLSNLAREAGVSPSAPPTSMRTFSPPPTIQELADWRYLAFVGSLLAVSIGAAAWWWSSSVHTETMAPSDPAPLTQDAPTAVALASDLAQQLQPMEQDLAALRQAVAQLEMRQAQLLRENEDVASQLKASQAEIARNNIIIEQIKATQTQVERKSETVTERLNESQRELARVIATSSEPKVSPEEPKGSPEEPKAMPEIPVPRPRPTNVAQTHKPVPTAERPQASKPQPLAWPWSPR
ncbi:hypothetical protein I3J27_30255 [Bradyrhizobium xenonodulans]|uniref:Uncharacterized protein n=1 Tax=Bradyrhizobium xenonodulans TaxID=2736875 RepID=A0ABY7MFT1_9BRAD|nr:hypothetical protein [Bradyrhizobium xenonodulans]WBL77270.1 hypothetical protein I3J27_30255 [Bradyrhizobium xenonodulans]